MTTKSKKIKEIICKIFGHNVNSVELFMFEIECKATNARHLDPKISCKRCGKTWKLYAKNQK